jgi:ATP-dependent Lon protease
MAGDMAVMDGSQLIEDKHIKFAVKNAISIEDQILERYQSFEQAMDRDISSSQKIHSTRKGSPNDHVDRSYL